MTSDEKRRRLLAEIRQRMSEYEDDGATAERGDLSTVYAYMAAVLDLLAFGDGDPKPQPMTRDKVDAARRRLTAWREKLGQAPASGTQYFTFDFGDYEAMQLLERYLNVALGDLTDGERGA